MEGHSYLLVVDYYSRFIEIAKLSSGTSSLEVVRYLKSIMAHHGIPTELVSDNRPQFSAETFTDFIKEYSITHKTSSPRHPQGNGEAERAVKAIKSILNKSDDPYSGLLAYRTTALPNGYSPSVTHLLNSATAANSFLSTVTYTNRPQGERPKVEEITEKEL